MSHESRGEKTHPGAHASTPFEAREQSHLLIQAFEPQLALRSSAC
jgi:hypothetical protein